MDVQEIYINLDDSGKLNTNEEVCVYGGIVFFSKKEKDKFIVQYKGIVNKLKCKYCKHDIKNCNNNCPELKHYSLKPSHKRWIINYLKKYYTVAFIIKNKSVFSNIMKDKASRGRYLDYVLRVSIKGMIKTLIQVGKIDPNKDVKIILNLDEQTTKSNGYYTLKDGLIEELSHGIYNFNYSKQHKPILFGNVIIELNYLHSDKSYVVQAADLIVGEARTTFINNKFKYRMLLFHDYFKIFP